MDDQNAMMAERGGKPWAMLSYHSSLSNSMGMNLIRGLTIDLIAVFLLSWMLLKFTDLDMKNAVLASLAVGIIRLPNHQLPG